jgi:uncharacterized protein (DUF1015 family)
MIIRPFRALRPDPSVASQVAAVPYDVVNRDEARKLTSGLPLSFLHVSRPEIDLPDGTDPYSSAVYEKARSNLAELTKRAPLVREDEPSLYVYRLTMGPHTQTGLVGTFSIDEYDSGAIRKHERTRKDKEDDRTRHVLTLSAQTGPVFLTYRDVSELDRLVAQVSQGMPLYSFTAPDGIKHEAWRVEEPGAIIELFDSRVRALYIADGHHRAAAASRARAELASRSGTAGPADPDFVLAVAFPASQLRILPYYRVVLDLGGLKQDEFLARAREHFSIERRNSAVEPGKGEFGLCWKESGRIQWHLLKPLAPRPRGELDVAFLQECLLGPVLGITDPRTDSRIDFVGGIRGTQELERRVQAGAALAFSLHPTRIEEVMEISDQGGTMPPKSTWFEPKLRDGLFSHLL